MSRVGSALTLGALVVTAATLMRGSASAHFVPNPCDFITGGGFVFKDDGARANFGVHEGCKNGDFWGGLNYVDHGGFGSERPYHVKSVEITGYLCDPAIPNARDTCGWARTNAGERVRFRSREIDNGEGANAACKDEFGIRLSNGYVVSTRPLAGGDRGGGNIQYHADNPSTTGPVPEPSEFAMCGGLEGMPVGNPGPPTRWDCPVNPEAQANCTEPEP